MIESSRGGEFESWHRITFHIIWLQNLTFLGSKTKERAAVDGRFKYE